MMGFEGRICQECEVAQDPGPKALNRSVGWRYKMALFRVHEELGEVGSVFNCLLSA